MAHRMLTTAEVHTLTHALNVAVMTFRQDAADWRGCAVADPANAEAYDRLAVQFDRQAADTGALHELFGGGIGEIVVTVDSDD